MFNIRWKSIWQAIGRLPREYQILLALEAVGVVIILLVLRWLFL